MAEPRGRTVDVVVIGAGLAGLTTAVRVAQHGLAVMVLEQGEDRYPCNTRYSGGILHVAYQDVRSNPDHLGAAMRRAMGGDADGELIDAHARGAGPALDWLASLGARFIAASPTPWHRWTLAPPRPLRPGLDVPGAGPDRMLGVLECTLAKLGGTLLRGHAASSVRRRPAGLEVVAETAAGQRSFPTSNVVFADGGFQGAADLVARFINPHSDRMVQRGAGTGSGTAVRMAGELGCTLTRMDRFYGHLLGRDALCNSNLSPYPQLDLIAAAGIVVDRNGRRFADERLGGVYLSNEIAKLDDPAEAVAIIDARIWATEGRQSLYPANPNLESGGGTLIRADTVAELAARIGVDAQALAEGVRAKQTETSGEGTQSTAPVLATPPFIAVPLAVGITNTMGGPRVDARARALSADGSPVPGIYAVGASAGGLEGGERVGYAGGLMRAVTSGLAAADCLAGAAPDDTLPPPRHHPVLPRPRYPVLELLARQGALVSLGCGLVALIVPALLLWPPESLADIVICFAVAAIGAGIAKAFAELASIVLDLLVR